MQEIITKILSRAPKEILDQYLGSISNMPLTELQTKVEENKVESFNAEEGSLTGFDCKLCKNKGYIAHVRDGQMIVSECQCMNRRRLTRNLERSGLSSLLDDYTFANYKTEKEWQKNAKNKAIDFAEHPSGWFVITGTPGTGKTHLCTAICSSLLDRGKVVKYMLWRDDAPRLKACVNERDVYEAQMNEYKDADVLYIDDFWKGNITEADINLSFELLNSRYNDRGKITIISGEKDIEQILEIDEAIGSRIYEKSKVYLIKTPAENYRLR